MMMLMIGTADDDDQWGQEAISRFVLERGGLSVCYSDSCAGRARSYECWCRDVGNWREMMHDRMNEYEWSRDDGERMRVVQE